MRRKKRLIHLHYSNKIPRRLLRRMLRFDPTLKKIYHLPVKDLQNYLRISFNQAIFIHNYVRNRQTYARLKQELQSITPVTIFDDEYPSLLKHIYDPPLVLYCLGDIQLLNATPSLSVIGTRKPSTEGPQKLHFILAPLIHHKWTIISGLAYGIDRHAHEITLQYKGKTIAVLGSGFHHIYPKAHEPIFKDIVHKGLVITEYPPYVRAEKSHFPERNRIVSGLTKATLVIEAEERSGTNITVDHALEQGKEVYAVPGSILNAQTTGCHRLIQQGAKLVMHAGDILEDYALKL